VINENPDERIATSIFERFRFKKEFRRNPAPLSDKYSKNRKRIYLDRGFKESDHLRKSFMAVYIAAKTPKRERIIVKTGFSKPASLSSFMPPQVVTRIIPNIWNAIPE
jgi:hypothetical protein